MDVVIEWIFIFILIPSFSSLICSFIFFSQSISSSAFAPRQAEKKKIIILARGLMMYGFKIIRTFDFFFLPPYPLIVCKESEHVFSQ